MNELTGLLDEALRHATFDGARSEPISLEQLRHTTLLRQMDSSRFPVPMYPAWARVSDEPLAKLTDHMRKMLAKFVHSESDRIGVISAINGVSEPSLKEFALTLVRGAATLGTAPTARLLAEWADGRPFEYHLKTLLGAVPDGVLTLDDSVSIHPRPEGRSMPRDEWVAGIVQKYGSFEFHHCAIMSIESAITPVFYPPGKGDSSVASVRSQWARDEMPDRFLDTFCDSLSLACNGCVRHGPYWHDHGNLEQFGSGSFGWTFSLGPKLTPGPPLSQRQLEHARDIHRQRLQVADGSRSLDIAISHWLKSKHPLADLPDRFINLRIALEALYVPDRSKKERRRLATHAAQHLSCDENERSEYFSTVHQAYRRASTAVHASEIEDDQCTRSLLSKAQNACHDGILKQLKESSEPVQDRLVFGDVD